MESNRIDSIQKCFNRITNSNQIIEAVLLVENMSGDFTYSIGYGKKDVDSPMIMASITKLFTTTCILILREHGKLFLDDNLAKYFDQSTLSKLHIYKGKEYSFELTIYDLLHQASGLPDIYQKTKNSIKNVVTNQDIYIEFDDMLGMVKSLKPHFKPQAPKKAYYANINFDILGEIIEKVTNLPLEQVYKKFIFEPLELKNTYLPISENECIPHIFYKEKPLYRPKIIMSGRASGGCITTARELMIFIKAFFGGKLFNKDIFKNETIYRKLQLSMSPMRYGCGYMQIPLGGIETAFQGKGELIGHSGSTGSFAFYYPYKDLFFVGDVNQISNPAIPVRLAIQLAILIK